MFKLHVGKNTPHSLTEQDFKVYVYLCSSFCAFIRNGVSHVKNFFKKEIKKYR